MQIELAGPVAGVVGQLNERLDLGLLESVADSGRACCSSGRATSRTPRCAEPSTGLISRENVQWIDRQPYDRMPSVLAQLSVGLTPYTASAFNRGSFPLKTLDYLAAGLPVVSSDLPSARLLGSPDVALATTPRSSPGLTCAPAPAASASTRPSHGVVHSRPATAGPGQSRSTSPDRGGRRQVH